MSRPAATPPLVIAWLLVGALWVWAAGWPPVSRAQEARVLETAREMIGRPAADWLVPKLNDAVRLRKPPLAYWTAAASMSVLGDTERAGRLPTVVLSWLTLGLTFAVARRLFDTRVATLAAGILAGSWGFVRFGLLAETDAPMAAFLTAGVYAALRAADAVRDGGRAWPWQHALAVCGAGVVMAKGPPAAFLALFVVGLCAVRRDGRPLVRFFSSGAVVTLLSLAAPWFAYVRVTTTQEGQLGDDLLNSAGGGDHEGPPWNYVPMLLLATLPWTPVWAVALGLSARRLWGDVAARRAGRPRRFDSGLWVLTVWGAAIFLPLACWGNKQIHYLLPLMPPTAVLTGWAAARATRTKAVAIAMTAMAIGLAVAGPAVAIVAYRWRPGVMPFDAALAGALVMLSVNAFIAMRRGGVRAARLPLAANAIAALCVAYAWLPTLTGGLTWRASAELTAAYPDAHFVSRETALPVMSWSMRRVIRPVAEAELPATASDPRTVILDQQRDDEPQPAVPAGFVTARVIPQRGNILRVYVPATRPANAILNHTRTPLSRVYALAPP